MLPDVHYRQSAVPVSVGNISVFELLIFLHKRDGHRYVLDQRSREEIEAELPLAGCQPWHHGTLPDLQFGQGSADGVTGRDCRNQPEKSPCFPKWINR